MSRDRDIAGVPRQQGRRAKATGLVRGRATVPPANGDSRADAGSSPTIPGPAALGRAVPIQRGRPAAGAELAGPVGVAKVSQSREATRRVHPLPPVGRPVFVDESGRRLRLLTWIACGVVLLGVLLTAALWVSQAVFAIRLGDEPGCAGNADPGTCVPARPAGR